MARRSLAVLACLFLVSVGCAADEDGGESPVATQDGDNRPKGPPHISITKPTDGSRLKAGDIEVTAAISNFSVVNKLGEDPVKGEGHVHFYFDVGKIPTAKGKPAVTDDESTYHAAATNAHTWKDVEAGKRTFAAQLVNNNHTPLEPPVTVEVTVTVE